MEPPLPVPILALMVGLYQVQVAVNRHRMMELIIVRTPAQRAVLSLDLPVVNHHRTMELIIAHMYAPMEALYLGLLVP